MNLKEGKYIYFCGTVCIEKRERSIEIIILKIKLKNKISKNFVVLQAYNPRI